MPSVAVLILSWQIRKYCISYLTQAARCSFPVAALLNFKTQMTPSYNYPDVTNKIYDDDIKIISEASEIPGPRIQFKEIFGVGFSYNF